MGGVVSRMRQLALGDMDSALDPDAYRPKLETEFTTPESKSITRIQLPDPRSISQGIERTPLYAFVKKEETPGIVNSTPLRSKADDQIDEEREISVSSLPKRLLETNLDDSHCEEAFEDQLETVEIDVLIDPEDVYYPDESNNLSEVTCDQTECSTIPNVDEENPSSVIESVEESTEPEECKEGSPQPDVTSGIDLLSLRQNLFTTPQQQSVKTKRVPLGFVCPNTFDSTQENVLSTNNTNDKNWKSVADERHRLGLTASSDPENTPPSLLRLNEPPEVVQSAPGKFRNPSRRRFESKNSPGLFI